MSWFSNTWLETHWPWWFQVLTINNSSLRIHWGTDGIQHLPKHSLQYLQRNEEECIQYTVYTVYPVNDRSVLPSPFLLIALFSPFGFLCIYHSFLWVSKFLHWEKTPRTGSYFSSCTFPLRLSSLLFFAILFFFSPEKNWEAHVSDNSTIFCSAVIMKALPLCLWVLQTWVWLKNLELLLDLN